MITAKGIQVTNIQIRKQCRENRTPMGALEEAFEIIREKYYSTMKADCNKDATFHLCLTVDRDEK